MKTLLLPGFSSHNKAWGEEMKEALLPELEVEVFNWPHWDTGTTENNWIEMQVEKLLNYAGPVHILAKSVGTLITVKALQKKPDLAVKIVFCGVPLKDLGPGEKDHYSALKQLDPSKILCIQNTADHYGSFEDAQIFIHSINQNIVMIEKDRADHAYPYPDEFKNFLRDVQ